MSIQFDSETMPTKTMILDQAAGAGIEFAPESLAELHFVEFCQRLWLHGLDTGVARLKAHLEAGNSAPAGR